jgi:hypothetical protein
MPSIRDAVDAARASQRELRAYISVVDDAVEDAPDDAPEGAFALAVIVVAILAIAKAKVTTKPDEATIASLSADKLFDLLKSLATSAPLMLGGVVLYLVAAIAAKSITLG